MTARGSRGSGRCSAWACTIPANQVRDIDPPRAIAWATGTEDAAGRLSFGGWVWRYDLAPAADGGTQVRLTYDWSGATPEARAVLDFPPFDAQHLQDALRRLAVLAAAHDAPDRLSG